jgi:Arc/MetJ family transcription regulator
MARQATVVESATLAHALSRPSSSRRTGRSYLFGSALRTNIEIDDDYVEAIMDRYGLRTKTEAVDLALRHLAGQPMTREEALAMEGARAILDTPADVPPRTA